MITKEKAIQIAKEYTNERKRSYLHIVENKVYQRTKEVIYGKKDFGEEHQMWVVPYEVESWDVPIPHFINIKAETGEIYYTSTQHGYAEDWEEDEEGNVLEKVRIYNFDFQLLIKRLNDHRSLMMIVKEEA